MSRSTRGRSSSLVLGLMSGTSADGIDVALVRIPHSSRAASLGAQLVDFHTVPYPPGVRAEVLRVSNGGRADSATISNLNFLLGELFARAALGACARFGVRPRQIDLIGSHGQTVYHQSRAARFLSTWRVASTLQIGEPAVITEHTGITTVGDFRPADVAAGGQGAPLVPFVDYLLFRHVRRARVALNIGGIANLSVIPANAAPDRVIAFDTGPGNMVIDALLAHFTRGRQSYDRDAAMARRGLLLPPLLKQLLEHLYFQQPPPKSCGREQFGEPFATQILEWGKKNRARPEDLVRTATLLTPLSILAALHRWVLPQLAPTRAKAKPQRSSSQSSLWRQSNGAVQPCDLILSGGGAHNPLIRAQLEAGLRGQPIRILTSGGLGVPEDGKEAYAFAVLAWQTLHRRPGNLPSATGARHPAILGKICYASR